MKEHGVIVTLRIPRRILEAVTEAMASRRRWQARGKSCWHRFNAHADGRTAWILRAIREKLAKLVRGRLRRMSRFLREGR